MTRGCGVVIAIAVAAAACGTGPARRPGVLANRGAEPGPAAGAGDAPQAFHDDVDRLRAATRAGAPARVWLDAATTLTFGCSCPGFLVGFRSEEEAMNHNPEGEPVMTLAAPGVADPADTLLPDTFGRYELVGYFRDETLTGVQWNARRGRVPRNFDPQQASAYWRTPAPVFTVESWCFRFADDVDPTTLADYADQLAAMQRDRTLCNAVPGT